MDLTRPKEMGPRNAEELYERLGTRDRLAEAREAVGTRARLESLGVLGKDGLFSRMRLPSLVLVGAALFIAATSPMAQRVYSGSGENPDVAEARAAGRRASPLRTNTAGAVLVDNQTVLRDAGLRYASPTELTREDAMRVAGMQYASPNEDVVRVTTRVRTAARRARNRVVEPATEIEPISGPMLSFEADGRMVLIPDQNQELLSQIPDGLKGILVRDQTGQEVFVNRETGIQTPLGGQTI